MTEQPFIVALGGTTSETSSTETALRIAVAEAEQRGARTMVFGGRELAELPLYLSPGYADNAVANRLLAAVRRADGVILASPGYHGSISGLIKNAIDYLEETARDRRAYLDGVPVGLVTTAYGWQATGSTMVALRAIVHALRGWPTPFGAAINSSGGIFTDGACVQPAVLEQLKLVGRQVHDLAELRQLDPRRLHMSGARR
jgi:FMN reductase